MRSKPIVLVMGVVVAFIGAGYTRPATARTVVSLALPTNAPPVRVVERIGTARRGRLWIPGCRKWMRGHYVWSPGHRAAIRPGYRYVPARWARCGRHWCLHGGHRVR